MFNYLPDNAPTFTHPTHTPLLTKADVPMSRVTSPQSLVHGMLVLSLSTYHHPIRFGSLCRIINRAMGLLKHDDNNPLPTPSFCFKPPLVSILAALKLECLDRSGWWFVGFWNNTNLLSVLLRQIGGHGNSW